MELDKKAVQEFREIYKKEFCEEIDEATARERARRLLELLKLIYRNHGPRRNNN